MGHPIITYSIDAAIQSGLFEEVMVSTDDEEIAAIAKKQGAMVPFMRSPKTAGDFSGTAEVLLEVLDRYAEKGKTFDNICCIYPCAPFVTAQRLIEGRNKLIAESLDTVLPIVRFSFPIQRAFKLNEGKVSYIFSENALQRSQDLEASFHDAGQFYWLRVKNFLHSGRIIGSDTGAIVLSEKEVQDIDELSDWELAELKYVYLVKNGLLTVSNNAPLTE